ncbi:MAG: hypothetical protein JWO70_8 [Betaproteobacteria bacterium]|nr:hypothetical protein [Betaproteobacteria bacterium]
MTAERLERTAPVAVSGAEARSQLQRTLAALEARSAQLSFTRL